MLDSYSVIWGRVLLRCPLAGSFLARDWVSHSFRRVAERRRWSWLMKQGQILSPATYTTGTVTCVRGSTTVTGAATAWTNAMVDRQFRRGNTAPIYTIVSVNVGAQTLVLDQPWGGASVAGGTYEIYQCYFPVPTDFHSFYSVYDPRFNWQLNLNYTQKEINSWDAQRAMSGQAYIVAFYDYYTPAAATLPLARYELWPHQRAEYVYPYVYETRPTDLEDSGATLPRHIRGDVLMEGALAMAARWPGPSEDKKNPYWSIPLASMHDARFEQMVMEMEKQDNEVLEQDLTYQSIGSLPFSPMGDVNWLQTHVV